MCSLALGFSSVFLRMFRDRAFCFKSSIGCSGRGLLYASSLEFRASRLWGFRVSGFVVLKFGVAVRNREGLVFRVLGRSTLN